MSVPEMNINSEILKYYLDKLNDTQKQALLAIAKAFVHEAEEPVVEEPAVIYSIDTDSQRNKLIQAEREKYLRGEGVSYTPEQVKEMALNS